MKKDCEVVRDLMPLVLDDVASDGSKHMVSAHLQTCTQRSTPPPRRCGSRSAAAPSAISCWVR